MTLFTRNIIITVSILPNILRINIYQRMNFFSLMKCNMGNISLEKLYTTSCRETCPNPFLKNQPGSTA